jgi:hypothetical protein
MNYATCFVAAIFEIGECLFVVVMALRFAQNHHNNKLFTIDSKSKSIIRIAGKTDSSLPAGSIFMEVVRS